MNRQNCNGEFVKLFSLGSFIESHVLAAPVSGTDHAFGSRRRVRLLCARLVRDYGTARSIARISRAACRHAGDARRGKSVTARRFERTVASALSP